MLLGKIYNNKRRYRQELARSCKYTMCSERRVEKQRLYPLVTVNWTV